MKVETREKLLLSLKGMTMGIAEVIPGISGGTIAFITGIYEELLDSIRSFTPALIIVFRNQGLSGVWKRINGNFLIALLAGMVAGLGIGIFGISYLLEHYPLLLWAFFFGLILASVFYVGMQILKWRWIEVLLLIIGTVLAYMITIAAPAQGIDALWFVFVSGAIAICALILPGLSGSFILLLMGMYSYIIPTVKDAIKTLATDKLIVVGVFAAGCLTGLLTFSHVLSWMFKRFRGQTLALLTGFLIGSLNKVWPWQQVVSTRLNSDKELEIEFTQSVLPATFAKLPDSNLLYGNDPQIFSCISLMIGGALIVLGADLAFRRFSNK